MLKQKSAERIAVNSSYQKFLKKLEKVRARQSGMVNSVDEAIEMNLEDLQMQEAVNIVKDMIQINEAARPAETTLLPTGSD